MSSPTTKILGVCAAASLALTAGASFGQTTTILISPTINNGSFETNPGVKTDFLAATSGTAAIPYWGSTTGTNDTGVDVGADIAENGTYGAFEQPTTGIFNLVTTRPIQAGDVYTLTFYARDTNGGTSTEPLTATFFSQAVPAGATYTYTPIATLATITPTITNAVYSNASLETLTYTATTAGNDIGIAITNSGGNYNGLDNFNLSVTSAVPEPSTYALLSVGAAGLLFLRRRMLA